MSPDKDFTPDELRLLNRPAVQKPRKPKDEEVKASEEREPVDKRAGAKGDKQDQGQSQERGPLSPVQFDDDGWGDTPAQMRG